MAARRSITLPSYKVISPAPVSHTHTHVAHFHWRMRMCTHTQDQEDNLVFCLIHPGTGKEYFKVDTEEQLER